MIEMQIRRRARARRRFDAIAAFEAVYALQSLRRLAEAELDKIDLLFLPTAGTIYTIAEVEAEPVTLNANLGYYTNFVNLLDLCGVAVPGGFTGNKLPTGVTLLSTAGQEPMLLEIADRFHRQQSLAMGATHNSIPPKEKTPMPNVVTQGTVRLAVVGGAPQRPAAQRPVDRSTWTAGSNLPHIRALPPLRTACDHSPQAGPHSHRSDRGGRHRGRSLGIERRSLRKLCGRHSRSTRGRHHRARRWGIGQRVPLRGICDGRGKRYLPVWGLESISRGVVSNAGPAQKHDKPRPSVFCFR